MDTLNALNNEPSAEIPAPIDPSIVQKIAGAANSAMAAVGNVVKRGRGRPPKNGMPKKSDVLLPDGQVAETPGLEPVPADADTAVSPALLRRCIGALVKGASGAFSAFIGRKAESQKFSPVEVASLKSDLAITSDELDAISELTDILLKKYNADTKYAPEICLGLTIGQIGLRYGLALKALTPVKPEKPAALPT